MKNPIKLFTLALVLFVSMTACELGESINTPEPIPYPYHDSEIDERLLGTWHSFDGGTVTFHTNGRVTAEGIQPVVIESAPFAYWGVPDSMRYDVNYLSLMQMKNEAEMYGEGQKQIKIEGDTITFGRIGHFLLIPTFYIHEKIYR